MHLHLHAPKIKIRLGQKNFKTIIMTAGDVTTAGKSIQMASFEGALDSVMHMIDTKPELVKSIDGDERSTIYIK